MEIYGRVELLQNRFLTMSLDKGVWFAWAPLALLLRIGLPISIGWVGHRTSMDAAETKTLLPIRNGTTLNHIVTNGKTIFSTWFFKMHCMLFQAYVLSIIFFRGEGGLWWWGVICYDIGVTEACQYFPVCRDQESWARWIILWAQLSQTFG